ncbi:MAG: DUF5010 domain-containing protein [Planctomycetota bacterium]|jgi:hypothetical protein
MTVIDRDKCLWIPLLFIFCTAAFAAEDKLPKKPPGKFFPLRLKDHRGADSFKLGQPVVGTSYFYWYDIDTKSHIIDHDDTDALTTHPADMNDISYKRISWHKQQLKDMIAAGVDFLLPVFWGVPGKYKGWSFTGLTPLVEAHSILEKEGYRPPAIGLFYDTSILKWNGFNKDGTSYHVDLTTDFGKDWFYTAIRDFFSVIPPSKWARVDGKPIVFLYAAAFAKKQDQKQFEYVKGRFKKDFGSDLFLVKQPGWLGEADAMYSWGGAVNGPLRYRQTVALGPGYDHSAVPGRAPLIVERYDGETYIERWSKVLQLNPKRRPWIVHVETWNEWHEGTDVADSREYGRSYIVLTRLFADMWRAKARLRTNGPYPDSNSVTWEPGQPKGLELRQSGGDGFWKAKKFGNVEAVVSDSNPHSDKSRYLYFNVDDAFAYELFGGTVSVSVTYRDSGCSSFHLEYDNTNPKIGPLGGAFRPAGNISVDGSGKWKTAKFTLPQCRFMNRCNGADFRIVVLGGDLALTISKVELVKTR